MILTPSDFTKNTLLTLPQAVSAPGGADYVAKIQKYIDVFEEEILIEGLGIDLFEQVKTGLNDLPNAPEKIQNLVEGLDYTYENVKVRWEGMQINNSFLAYYVYWSFLQGNVDYVSVFGVERPEGINSRSASSNQKAVDPYREFRKKYQTGYDYNYKNTNVVNDNPMRSLYQYLRDNKDVYGDVLLKPKGSINRFGI